MLSEKTLTTESTSSTIASPELAEKDDPSRDADHSSTSNVSDSTLDDPYQVTLDASEHPQSGLSTFRKWLAVVIISTSALCVACASSIAAFTEDDCVGIGPLFVGPLSEVYGRNIIYQVSYTLFFAFSWPVAFAPNIAVYLIFRFFTGLCGAAFLSVAGGSVSDMFTDATVANPMAFYTISPFIGPVLGPLISGFINQNLNWRWTWRIALIWVFAQWIALLLFVPETYVPVLLKRKAQRVRKSTGNTKYYAPLEKVNSSVFGKILVSCYRPFQLILYDRMALLLDVWNALILGILYLTFQAFPIVFERGHGFNMQETGLSFLGIGLGMLIAIFTQPFWNRRFARQSLIYDGNPPPEARLIMGQVGAILVPISLYWLAFTTYSHVHWIAPIIASVPFGSGIYFVFMSTFTYLVTAYRPIAASAMASNSSMRSMFAAVFPLFAGAMYNRLGTVGATALLAGLTTIMAPLPFIFYKIGYRLRQQSRFAVH
ncbi:hypothetical protein PTI98_012282 [Pleurotus ostreatus]|nr:hypothetical protein PTI98_012282 [Pleurotus ostreatus]